MKAVYKYDLSGQRTTLKLACGAQILHADVQEVFDIGSSMPRHAFKVWALVDKDTELKSDVEFLLLCTGEPVDEDFSTWKFLNTFLAHKGAYVFHVYYKVK